MNDELKNEITESKFGFTYTINMPLRDYFAAHAPIAKFIAPEWTADNENIEKNAEFAYRWADAMIKAKNKENI